MDINFKLSQNSSPKDISSKVNLIDQNSQLIEINGTSDENLQIETELNNKIDTFLNELVDNKIEILVDLDERIKSAQERILKNRIKKIKDYKKQNGIPAATVTREILDLYNLNYPKHVIDKLDNVKTSYKQYNQKMIFYWKWYKNHLSRKQNNN
ncbi:unnamed protein product [Brachionus calyciflorus]|uniref:Uncharacterized protein n=1 Tax=Brachionus calyciflorus TaxID=104777 RepID=A0A813SV29_9BILA|nr:unnamed protein product [Brachionus calyciflorus]